MIAEIISVGTELTIGRTVDTNAAWLSRRLVETGVTVVRHVTVPDQAAAIRDAVRSACASDVVLVTGGLGPTADDVTRDALADAVDRPLVSDPTALGQIRRFFGRLNRPMPPRNERQARIPAGASVLENTSGTAPGIRLEHGSTVIYAMPGVPREMAEMYEQSVAPELTARSSDRAIVTRVVNCFGATESTIASQIEDLMAPGQEPAVGVTAHEGIIKVSVVATGPDRASAVTAARAVVRTVERRLGRLVFGHDDETLQEAVGALLVDAGLRVATAESCTGGLLAKRFTDVPGSSRYFIEGLVTYADQAKRARLHVPRSLIERHGAVSEQVADAMARHCRAASGADAALALTGVAGPGGGSDEKPVGLVFIGLAMADGCRVRRWLFGDHLSRAVIRNRACNVALNTLRLRLLDRLSQRGTAP